MHGAWDTVPATRWANHGCPGTLIEPNITNGGLDLDRVPSGPYGGVFGSGTGGADGTGTGASAILSSVTGAEPDGVPGTGTGASAIIEPAT